MELEFQREKHIEYLLALDKSKDLESIGMFLRNHLKVAGGYWCLTSLELLQVPLPKDKKEELIALFASCQNADGGCGGNVGHDSHITSTHYVVLVLAQWNALDKINIDGIVSYIKSMENSDVNPPLSRAASQETSTARSTPDSATVPFLA
jgi:geranylgeranyl transferase type-2 subunit beta